MNAKADFENRDGIIAYLEKILDPIDAQPSLPIYGDGSLNGRPSPTGRDLKPAAVLALLVENKGVFNLVLTRRADHLPSHPGQISFPGGGQNLGQEALYECALRETEEEIGIEREQISLLGRWENYETVTGYDVAPFLGVINGPGHFKPNPSEVAEIFFTPLEFLMNSANHRLEEQMFGGVIRRFYSMAWNDYFIWGATAGMLITLSERFAGPDKTG